MILLAIVRTWFDLSPLRVTDTCVCEYTYILWPHYLDLGLIFNTCKARVIFKRVECYSLLTIIHFSVTDFE